MQRTSSKAELGVMLGVAVIALTTAIAATVVLADAPSADAVRPVHVVGINYLAGFTLALVIRIVERRTRPTSLKGLIVPAMWYALAATAATSGPNAFRGLTGGGLIATMLGAIASAMLAIVLFRHGIACDHAIDPAEAPSGTAPDTDRSTN